MCVLNKQNTKSRSLSNKSSANTAQKSSVVTIIIAEMPAKVDQLLHSSHQMLLWELWTIHTKK